MRKWCTVIVFSFSQILHLSSQHHFCKLKNKMGECGKRKTRHLKRNRRGGRKEKRRRKELFFFSLPFSPSLIDVDDSCFDVFFGGYLHSRGADGKGVNRCDWCSSGHYFRRVRILWCCFTDCWELFGSFSLECILL